MSLSTNTANKSSRTIDSVHVGSVEIQLRRLSEATWSWLTALPIRVEQATQGRVPAKLVQPLLCGGRNASPAEKQALGNVSLADYWAVRRIAMEAHNRALCEGIASWCDHAPASQSSLRPCTDANKRLLGNLIRQKCVDQIVMASLP
ncbi:hypothetical protein EON83_29210 [bacterium]|nr:MAG: hypothetical protein EON83_29210 [bacterium]